MRKRNFLNFLGVLLVVILVSGCAQTKNEPANSESASNSSANITLSPSPSPTSQSDPFGILARLNSVQAGWNIDEVHNLYENSLAVYASPGNEGCFVWVFKRAADAESFGSNAVRNAQSPPMYWYGVDKVSKKRVVLLSMGAPYFEGNYPIGRCDSAMQRAFDVELLSSMD